MEIPHLNKVVSQRLLISLIGIALIQTSWRWAVAHLYTLPEASLAGFVTITTNTLYVTGAIVVFLVTGKIVYDWRMGTSQIQEVTGNISKIKEEVSRNTIKSKYFDDGKI